MIDRKDQYSEDWVGHDEEQLRLAAEEFAVHSSSWTNDEQFAYTALLDCIEQLEEERLMTSLKPRHYIHCLLLLRYVRSHGTIPNCDGFIRKVEAFKRIKDIAKLTIR